MKTLSIKPNRAWWWLPLYLLVWVLLDVLFSKTVSGNSRLWFTRIMLLIALTVLGIQNRVWFKALWHQSASGLGLAIWRIVFFGFFIGGYFIFGKEHIRIALLSMTQLPDSARVPLPFFGALTNWIPVNETLSRIGICTMMISSLFAMIGFKTRWAICLFVLAALYVFGVPQLFGKINHNHYLVWFPAILAFSGCGDLLSVDCWLKSHSLETCMRSQQRKTYGSALAGTWLLIGIIYFFPGFHKLWQSGLDWVISGNLSNIIRHKALELPGWQPALPVLRYPLLTNLLATGAVVFELGFIFMILHPKWRRAGIVAGLLFHLGTWLLLHIFFEFMALSYITFINWEKLLRRNALVQSDTEPKNNRSLNGIIIFLLAGNIICGILDLHSWPLSCYPTFSSLPGNATEVLEFDELTSERKWTGIPLEKFHRSFPEERFRGLELQAIDAYRQNNRVLFKTLTESLAKDIKQGKPLRVYLVKITWENGNTIREKDSIPLIEIN